MFRNHLPDSYSYSYLFGSYWFRSFLLFFEDSESLLVLFLFAIADKRTRSKSGFVRAVRRISHRPSKRVTSFWRVHSVRNSFWLVWSICFSCFTCSPSDIRFGHTQSGNEIASLAARPALLASIVLITSYSDRPLFCSRTRICMLLFINLMLVITFD